ncbi:hypothetical protein GOFOIKOB_5817 [Methylobacterium tardum]|nr:hypothetical protein GOFOIKOB_5817 [Methylobacterium tardum]
MRPTRLLAANRHELVTGLKDASHACSGAFQSVGPRMDAG